MLRRLLARVATFFLASISTLPRLFVPQYVVVLQRFNPNFNTSTGYRVIRQFFLLALSFYAFYSEPLSKRSLIFICIDLTQRTTWESIIKTRSNPIQSIFIVCSTFIFYRTVLIMRIIKRNNTENATHAASVELTWTDWNVWHFKIAFILKI